ncbi:type II secretion system protein GspL [Aliidiomarina indica]|uniref:type II secretion system protein GspL n=1 Tax=Aliidiomarina indica TaxID=2749147 RepID=UPI0018905648|nr:type II secretion system protein GspL [Aliidiomarina indica]
MSEQLIIRLPADNEAPVSWLVWNRAQNELVASGELQGEHVRELAEKAKHRDLLVFASTLAIGLHELNLPMKSRRQLGQVIPFALEDELAEDIESLHFAWPDSLPKEDAIPVAVVAHEQMNAWLSMLASAGLVVHEIYPDICLLPVAEGEWAMAQFGSEWVLRTGAWQGTALDHDLLTYFTPDESMGEVTLVRAYGDVQWSSAPAPVESSGPALPLELAATFSPLGAINLLQGEYRVQQASSFSFRKFKFPAIAAAVCFAVVVANQWVTALQLERETRALSAQTDALYLQTFPNESRVQDPVAQMNAHVMNLRGPEGGNVLHLLQQLEPAFAAAPLQLTMMQYDASRGELRLQANGENFNTFERFTRTAREQNLDVNQGQLTSRGGQINGTILVRSGS